jgi:hypothetical protein
MYVPIILLSFVCALGACACNLKAREHYTPTNELDDVPWFPEVKDGSMEQLFPRAYSMIQRAIRLRSKLGFNYLKITRAFFEDRECKKNAVTQSEAAYWYMKQLITGKVEGHSVTVDESTVVKDMEWLDAAPQWHDYSDGRVTGVYVFFIVRWPARVE